MSPAPGRTMIRHDSRVARPVLENHRHPPPSSARARMGPGRRGSAGARNRVQQSMAFHNSEVCPPAFPAAYFCASLAPARSCFAAAAGVLFSWLSSERMRFYGMQLHPHRVDL